MRMIKSLKVFLICVAVAGAIALEVPATGSPAHLVQPAATLFQDRCAMCHGEDGKGKPNWRAKGQPDFTDAGYQKSRTDQEIAAVIEDGKGRYMPAFRAKLSHDQIISLVRQVRAFGKK